MSGPVDVHAILEFAGANPDASEGSQSWALAQVDAAVAELRAYQHNVEMIPSPVGTGYADGSAEDRAYIKGFNFALRLARVGGAS